MVKLATHPIVSDDAAGVVVVGDLGLLDLEPAIEIEDGKAGADVGGSDRHSGDEEAVEDRIYAVGRDVSVLCAPRVMVVLVYEVYVFCLLGA